MSKIAICGDIHWSEYSSILRQRGDKFSTRLEGLIRSVNWFNQLSADNNCSFNFYLGDFFDRTDLNPSEISALSLINWNSAAYQYFLCGNHEMYSVDHFLSSASVFSLLNAGEIFREPTIINIENLEICILPYILEENRKSIIDYFGERSCNKKRLILSHNDIKGLQMGNFLSEEGFNKDDIESNCDLFINGHLHNGQRVSEKIIDIGNLSGQNFSEDAYTYDHCAFILDTDTLRVAVYENPFAFNFYKLDTTKTPLESLEGLKGNAVITLKCNQSDIAHYKTLLESPKVISSRLMLQSDQSVSNAEINQVELTLNHLSEFKSFITNLYGNDSIVQEELGVVLNEV